MADEDQSCPQGQPVLCPSVPLWMLHYIVCLSWVNNNCLMTWATLTTWASPPLSLAVRCGCGLLQSVEILSVCTANQRSACSRDVVLLSRQPPTFSFPVLILFFGFSSLFVYFIISILHVFLPKVLSKCSSLYLSEDFQISRWLKAPHQSNEPKQGSYSTVSLHTQHFYKRFCVHLMLCLTHMCLITLDTGPFNTKPTINVYKHTTDYKFV